MSQEELAQSTRAWWANISPANVEQRGIRHAVAVHDGVTRAVMSIGEWIQRGNRWAFAATPVAHGPVFDEWVGPLGRRVSFERGSQSPVTYWPRGSHRSGVDSLTDRRHRRLATARVPSSSQETEGARSVDTGDARALLIRLGSWRENTLEIEPGTYRRGAGYREGMSLTELVDATRAWWRVNPERVAREGIRHAVAVHGGITRVVMEIGDWIRREDGRWAFSASPLTDGPVHDLWVGPSGREIDFPKGSQNPIAYWPPR